MHCGPPTKTPMAYAYLYANADDDDDDDNGDDNGRLDIWITSHSYPTSKQLML